MVPFLIYVQSKGGLSEMEFSFLYLETRVSSETMFSRLSRKSCRYYLYKDGNVHLYYGTLENTVGDKL